MKNKNEHGRKHLVCLALGLTHVVPLFAADAAPELKSTLVLPEIVVVGKRMAQAPAITYHETTALDFAAWNATTVAWRMFLHSAMSVALVEAAVNGVIVNADDTRELPDVIGEFLHPDALPLMVRQLRSVA